MYIDSYPYSVKLAHPSSFVRVYDQNNQTKWKILAHCPYTVLLVVTRHAVSSKRLGLGQGLALCQ